MVNAPNARRFANKLSNVFDKNKDGELDEEEREAARESFRRVVAVPIPDLVKGVDPVGHRMPAGRTAGRTPDRGGRARWTARSAAVPGADSGWS